MGSNVSHCNVSLIVLVKVTRQFRQTTTFEEKGGRQVGNQVFYAQSTITVISGRKRKDSRSGFEPRVPILISLTPYRWAKPAHEQHTCERWGRRVDLLLEFSSG